MKLEDIFGKKSAADVFTGTPFKVVTKLVPFRLSKTGSTEFYVTIQNLKAESVLTSIVLELPQVVGFDKPGLNVVREIRMGYLATGEEKTVRTTIYSNHRTKEGEQDISLTAIMHYRDYGHVLNSVGKKIKLRIV